MAERDYLTTGTASSTGAAGLGTERSSDEIRQNIAATRESITETVDELSSRVQRTFDWKTYVADYPLAATGVAVGLGVIVGLMVRPRPTPGERITAALADVVEDAADRFQTQLSDLGLGKTGASHTLRGAVIGMLLQAAGDFARNKIGTFQHREEQQERHADEQGYYNPRGY
ncbi:MAG TPA: DUF3618 domain-containing protein [Blastocatellia bacterium]|nr:DUF3618 domain-containing protein [Blastocatellia bacterium]